jgi:hypothetical protein
MQRRQFVIGCGDFSVVKPSFITFTNAVWSRDERRCAEISAPTSLAAQALVYELSPCHFWYKAASMITRWR